MPVPSILAVYQLAHTLAGRLPAAAARGRAGPHLETLAAAAEAVVLDAGRVSADECRAAGRLHAVLAAAASRPDTPTAAGVVAEMVVRWFGPRGLPDAEVAEFDRLAASLPASGGRTTPGCDCSHGDKP